MAAYHTRARAVLAAVAVAVAVAAVAVVGVVGRVLVAIPRLAAGCEGSEAHGGRSAVFAVAVVLAVGVLGMLEMLGVVVEQNRRILHSIAGAHPEPAIPVRAAAGRAAATFLKQHGPWRRKKFSKAEAITGVGIISGQRL